MAPINWKLIKKPGLYGTHNCLIFLPHVINLLSCFPNFAVLHILEVSVLVHLDAAILANRFVCADMSAAHREDRDVDRLLGVRGEGQEGAGSDAGESVLLSW